MHFRFVALAGALSVAAASQALVVDNFLTPYSFGFTAVNSHVAVTTPPPGTVLTGERDIEMAILSNPLSQFLDLNIGGGFQVTSNGFNTDGYVALQYDAVGDEAGNLGFGNTLTNSSFGGPFFGAGDDRVRLNWVGNDLAVLTTVVLRSGGSVIASLGQVRAGGSGAGAQDFVFSTGLMSSADSLTVIFDPAASGDFALSSIESVPEPATMAVLGLGVAALARRRRK